MTDIDRLHDVFMYGDCLERHAGHTTLFAWQLIGLSELNCYDYNVIKEPVWIPFNKPLNMVSDIIETVLRICRENNIDHSSSARGVFCINHTCFKFFRPTELSYNGFAEHFYEMIQYCQCDPGKYVFRSFRDNDAVFNERELTSKEDQNRAIAATLKSASVIGDISIVEMPLEGRSVWKRKES